MALNRYIDQTLDAPISVVRRHAIAIVICAAAAIGALYYFAAAAVVALEPGFGPAVARAIIGAGLLLIAVAAILIPRLLPHEEGLVERAQSEAQAMSREQKIALIIEALVAGFSLSSRRSRRKPSH